MAINPPKRNIQTLTFEYEKRDILQLFSEYLVDTLQYQDEDVLEELNDEIIDLLDNDPSFKKELEDTLYANQEKITSKGFILAGKKQTPTVANWVKEFIKAGIIERGLDFDRAMYFNQSKNFSNLPLAEKDLVAKLFDIYYRVKFYPQSLEDLPLGDDLIVPINPIKKSIPEKMKEGAMKLPVESAVKIDANQDLVNIYYQTMEKFTHLNEEKVLLEQKTENLIDKVIFELARAMSKKDLIIALAALELLAEKDNLDLLKKEASLASGFRKYVSRQMEPIKFKDFWGQDFNLKYLSQYLKWLLMNQLNQSENDSAVFALRLANVSRRIGNESFMKIAYGDSQNQSFKWQRLT